MRRVCPLRAGAMRTECVPAWQGPEVRGLLPVLQLHHHRAVHRPGRVRLHLGPPHWRVCADPQVSQGPTGDPSLC